MYKLKIQKFLIWIQETLLNTPDISINTIKLFIDSFESCLSHKEFENKTTKLLLRVIREVGIKQISIKTMTNKIINDNLENELNNLKGK